MSRNVFTAAVIAVLAVVAGTVSAAAASPPAGPSTAKATTLVFFVVFSPFTIIESNTDNPEASPVALGDENINHGRLFSHGIALAGCLHLFELRPQRMMVFSSAGS